MRIVILDGYTENPGDLSWAPLEAFGTLTVYDYTPADQIVERIGNSEIVLTNKTPLTKAILEQCPFVQYIGVLATGYNVVDTAYTKSRGIVVSNVPDYGTQAVAQYVFALLLELCHRVGHHNQAVQDGKWTSCRDFCFWEYPLTELMGKTMGIVGYGRIGKATAAIARAFGMRVLAYSPGHTGDEYVPLDTLFRESDVISLHCPLKGDNANMINAESIHKMKDGVMLINTARGALIDEPALRRSLLSGKIAGAAVDVVSTEPIRADNPLMGLDNCLITPHIAWANRESRARLMEVALNNVRAFVNGAPVNTVG